MTKQEIFDKIADHLLTQNAQCTEPGYNAMCRYRLDNMSCAIGCLIPDELYSKKLEGKEVTNRIVREVLKKADIVNEGRFLVNFQQMHDYFLPVDWSDELLAIAKTYKLNTSVLIKFKKFKP